VSKRERGVGKELRWLRVGVRPVAGRFLPGLGGQEAQCVQHPAVVDRWPGWGNKPSKSSTRQQLMVGLGGAISPGSPAPGSSRLSGRKKGPGHQQSIALDSRRPREAQGTSSQTALDSRRPREGQGTSSQTALDSRRPREAQGTSSQTALNGRRPREAQGTSSQTARNGRRPREAQGTSSQTALNGRRLREAQGTSGQWPLTQEAQGGPGRPRAPAVNSPQQPEAKGGPWHQQSTAHSSGRPRAPAVNSSQQPSAATADNSPQQGLNLKYA